MQVCRQCNGEGVTQNLAQALDYAANDFAQDFQGGTQGRPNNFPDCEIKCTGCLGTGQYNSFGSTGY
jgi:hypothetical protein